MPEASAALSKIATEALKPMSSVIDALLGPKIQRLRNWSEKQDLSGRLGSGTIDVLLDQYLRRLLRRICGITTIVFPQQVLPLTAIYEPLILRERFQLKAPTKPSPFDVSKLAEGLNYFIVDSAGMGKSTFAKHFILEILNSTTKIPMFLELRRINEGESLLSKLAAELDETKKDVDERLMPLLLSESEFVLILDGYDEVSEQIREGLGKQITQLAVQCENLQVIVTARPEVSLPELPDTTVLTIDPLTKEQAESLILRYDDVAAISVGRNLIDQFDVVSEQFLQTPLLVVLLYRTYGFNQSIATKITSFYDEVFNALYKGHDLSKAGFAREKMSCLDAEDFRRLLRGFSFLLSIKQKDNLRSFSEGIAIVDEAVRLTSIKPTSSLAFFEDLLLTVPLLVKEGTDYRFIHKSLGEFFTAEFLSYHPDAESIIERVRDGALYPSFINTFQYLSEINPSLFRRSIVAPIARSILGRDIKDPWVRTMRYLSPAVLELYPARYPVAPRDSSDFDSSSSMVGHYKGEKYRLEISFIGGHRLLPVAALLAISEDCSDIDDLLYGSEEHVPLDFLESVFGTSEWLRIEDERLMSVADNPIIRRLLIQANEFAVSQHRGYLPSSGMVVTVKACEDLLDQIQREEDTQSWLKALIEKETKIDESA